MRLTAHLITLALALLPASALAFDASRYPSPTLNAPNVDKLVIQGSGSTGDVSGMSVTATGGTAARTNASRASELVNIRDYGAKGDGSDDSGALAAAISRANTQMALGQTPCVYLPAGTYTIGSGTALPRYAKNYAGCVRGEGSTRSFLKLSSSFSGDLFSWSDAWGSGMGTGTSLTKLSQRGPQITGLAVIGERAATGQQNAFAFYDHNDEIYINDVDVHYLPGRAIYIGATLNSTVAYARESRIHNFRAFNSGLANIAAVEITNQCTLGSCVGQDGTNEIEVSDVGIYGARGPSFLIRNEGPANGGTLRQIRMTHVRLEGTEGNTNNVTADLMTIGDAGLSGPINNISCLECEAISPYTNYPAVRITSPDLTSSPKWVTWTGIIGQGGGGGAGLRVDSGRNLYFRFQQLGSAQTNLTIASSTTTGGPIYVDGGGAETTWTYAIDATALQYVRWSGGRWGTPSSQGSTQGITAQTADGTVNGGIARGNNSVDLQTTRFSSVHAASGTNSVLSGGSGNASGGTDTTVSGGNTNTAAGFRSTICGGFGNTTSGNGQYSFACGFYANTRSYGQMAFASGRFAAVGDAQASTYVMRGTTSTATAVRLTADATTAGSVSANCVVIAANYRFGIRITLTAQDTTNTANGFSAVWSAAHDLARGSTVSSTVFDGGTSAVAPDNTRSSGSVTGATATVAADTTNACLNISFTPPTGNAVAWHAVARIDTVEVQ